MRAAREILLFPKAVRDLERLDEKYTRQILEDLELLRVSPWPPGKIKKLRGTPLWEVKTGDYRSLFLPDGARAAVARVVNRRDLDTAIERLADHLHPELHPEIRIVKDCAAAGVLVIVAGALGVAAALLIELAGR